MIAHLAGVPLEELLAAPGAGALLASAWIMVRARARGSGR